MLERLGTGIALLWPALVYLLHQHLGAWPLLLVGSMLLAWRMPRARGVALAVAAMLLLLGLLGQPELGMRFYPVGVSLAMLLLFGSSLVSGMPVIEQIARLKDPQLPDTAIPYTRKVTWIWCLFFVVNGSIAAWTALYGSMQQWLSYNGLISYCLMGLMFAGEWCLRPRQQIH